MLEELAGDGVGNASQSKTTRTYGAAQTAGSEARACEGRRHGKWRLTYEFVREGRASFTLRLATRTRGLKPRASRGLGPGPPAAWGARAKTLKKQENILFLQNLLVEGVESAVSPPVLPSQGEKKGVWMPPGVQFRSSFSMELEGHQILPVCRMIWAHLGATR